MKLVAKLIFAHGAPPPFDSFQKSVELHWDGWDLIGNADIELTSEGKGPVRWQLLDRDMEVAFEDDSPVPLFVGKDDKLLMGKIRIETCGWGSSVKVRKRIQREVADLFDVSA